MMVSKRELLRGTMSVEISSGFSKKDKPSSPVETFTVSGDLTASFRAGDIFTIPAARPKWWRRLLIWLGLRKPPPALDTFIVTETATNVISAIRPPPGKS